MRSDLDHLPVHVQRDLARVRRVILEEFDREIAGGTQPWRRNGRILKIILFGSYARGDWVHNRLYQSDFDILVIVNHEKLTDDEYWDAAEDRLLRPVPARRATTIIVHTLGEVNDALAKGQYFFAGIARDGIALYDYPGHPLATPQPLTAADALAMAEQYRDTWLPKVDPRLETVEFQLSKVHLAEHWRNDAAFLLHQAIEAAYTAFLLTRTLYIPYTHNISRLRSLAEGQDERLAAAWPRVPRRAERPFNLIKRAYVEARYSRHYRISDEDMAAAIASARRLRDLVAGATAEWLDTLRVEAAADPAQRTD